LVLLFSEHQNAVGQSEDSEKISNNFIVLEFKKLERKTETSDNILG
jgi:hypothetical protein